MADTKRTPVTASGRVSASRARTLEGGARRIEVILRDPQAIQTLGRLVAELGSVRAVIEHLLRGARP